MLSKFPLLPQDDDDIVAKANDTIYGLASAVFSRDVSHALNIAKRLQAGSVWINCELFLFLALCLCLARITRLLLPFFRPFLTEIVPFSCTGYNQLNPSVPFGG